MAAMLDHLDQVSMFGRSAAALVVMLGIDWAFTAVHTWEEWRGESTPLWRVFGAVVGLWLPNWFGFLLFTLGLTLLLWSAGLVAIAGWFPVIGEVAPPTSVAALCFIIAARLTDTLVSHWGLYALGYRPNPGIRSTPLYILEAAALLIAFGQGLSLSRTAAIWGIAGGAGLFTVVVWLGLLALRAGVPAWRRTPWTRWQPLPAWTKD